MPRALASIGHSLAGRSTCWHWSFSSREQHLLAFKCGLPTKLTLGGSKSDNFTLYLVDIQVRPFLIVVDNAVFRLSTSRSFPEIFTIEV